MTTIEQAQSVKKTLRHQLQGKLWYRRIGLALRPHGYVVIVQVARGLMAQAKEVVPSSVEGVDIVLAETDVAFAQSNDPG